MVPVRFARVSTIVLGLILSLVLLVPAAFAVAPEDFPVARPQNHVIDSADVLSRASRSSIEKHLVRLGDQQLDARLVTIRRLDYGLSLKQLGSDLLDRWSVDTSDQSQALQSQPSQANPLLLLLIESQNKQAAVVADPELQTQLPDDLLTSVGRTTMSKQLRDGDRYRQAVFDGLERLEIVLAGGEDPGPPADLANTTMATNFPTQEETSGSNALTWIVVLLVVGSIVPMATWWVFSR